MSEINKGFITGFFLTVLNFLFHGSLLQSIITILEVGILLQLILRSKIKKAYFLHLLFIVTTIGVPINSENEKLYNYSKFEVLGPISISQVITVFFLVAVLTRANKNELKHYFSDIIFWIYIYFSGILFGLIGLLFFDYYIEHFVSYSVYVSYLIINLLIAIYFIPRSDIGKLRRITLGILASAPIASLFSGFIGVFGLYGGKEVYVVNELGYYTFILLPILIKERFSLTLLLGVIASCVVLVNGGTGGKGILFALIILAYSYTWIIKGKYYWNWVVGFLFRLIPPILLLVGYFSINANVNYGLFLYKLESIWVLLRNMGSSENLMMIPNSPRIRIVSIINIWEEGLLNPLKLIFGAGFGSYFHDFTNILSRSDLSDAFRTIEIENGRFGRPHDMPAAVPLANGLLGVILLIKVAYKYLKRIESDPFNFAVYPFLLLSFYYNHQFALIGLLLLVISNESLRRADLL